MLAVVAQDWSEAISPEYLFGNMPALIAQCRNMAFVPISFLMLCGYLKGALTKQSQFDLVEWARPLIVAIFSAVMIANIPWMLNTLDSAAVGIADNAGGTSAMNVYNNMWNVADGFLQNDGNRADDLKLTDPRQYATADEYINAMFKYHRRNGGLQPGESVDGLRAVWKAGWEATQGGGTPAAAGDSDGGWLSSKVAAALSKANEFIGEKILWAIKSVVSGIIFGVLWLGGVAVYFFNTLRYFLLQLGSVMLPVFIAGLATQYFRSQSVNYITSLIGVASWPIGWALGNLGTVALFTYFMGWVGNVLNSSAITTGNFTDPAAGAQAALAVNLAVWGSPVVSAGQITSALLVALLGSIIVLIWTLLVIVGYPMLIQKVVTSGATMFDSLARGTSSVALNAAGATAMLAGQLGAMNGKTLMLGGGGAGALTGGEAGSESPSGPPPLPGSGGSSPEISSAAGGGQSGGGSGGASSGGGGSSASGGGQGGSSRGVGRAAARAGVGRRGLAFSPMMALGASLQNAANWDGTPESAHRVLDTGIDETRKFSSETALADMEGIPEAADQAAASTQDVARAGARRRLSSDRD